MSDSIGIVTEVRFTVRDRMVISDPCYVDKDDGDTPEVVLSGYQGVLKQRFPDWGRVLDDCAGEWVGEVDVEDNVSTQGWGDRVSTLRLSRVGARTPRISYRDGRDFEYVGNAAVDSGQMYATDVENLPIDYEALLAQYGGDFRQLCLASGGGIVSSTGYGDGVYRVYVARDPDGRPATVEVRFMEEPEDDDYQEDEDD